MRKANFADLYLEKIVIAVAVLLALAGLYLYVVASPNRAEVNRREMAPAEIPELLAQRADELKASLDKVHELPPLDLPDFAENIATRNDRRPSPRFAFEPVDITGFPGSSNLRDLEPFDLPTPPLARSVVARQGTAVLEMTGEDAIDQPLIRLMNLENEPFDFRYVTVGGVFDLAEWRQRLKNPPGVEEPNPVRENWWQDTLEDVTGVFIERQELIDPATGEWSAAVRIDPLRELDALPADLDVAGNTTADIEAALSAIRLEQEAYRRTPFVRVARPYLLKNPFSTARSDDEERDLDELFDDIDGIDTRVGSIQRQIDAGASGERLNALRTREADELADRAEVAEKINKLIGESLLSTAAPKPIEAGEFDEIGADPFATQRRNQRQGVDRFNPETIYRQQNAASQRRAPVRQPGRRPVEDMAAEVMAPAEENPDEIQVWAHDLTVEPGKTYRYRLVVTVRNPLFRKTSVPPAQKKEHYDRLTLGPSQAELDATLTGTDEETATVWSNPVTIEPELYYFLIGSQARTARVEVWRVYDGRWRDAEFRVNPGDPIGGLAELMIDGNAIELPMQADDIAVDVVSGGSGVGGTSELIVVSGDTGLLDSRSASSGRAVIERIRLLNENRVNELIEMVEGDGERVAARDARQ